MNEQPVLHARSGRLTNNWKPETWGIGVNSAPGAATGTEKVYSSVLEKDSGTGKWKVTIGNHAATSPNEDRTFFVFAFARK